MSSQNYYNGNYINSVEITDKTATVTYAAVMDCSLTVAIYDDSGKQMLTSETIEVLASEREATVEISIPEMPEYFYVRAYLTDSFRLAPLCEEYENPNYTSQMAEFFAKTVADFDEEKVLNLDEDTTNNFVVFGDDVTIVEEIDGCNTVVTCDNENGIYVFENADETITSLQPGDIFSYDYGNEMEIIVCKVDTISVDGTTVTITSAETSMEEVFDYIKINEQIGQEDMEVSTEGMSDVLFTNIENEETEVYSQTETAENMVIASEEQLYKYDGDAYGVQIAGDTEVSITEDTDADVDYNEEGVIGTLDRSFKVTFTKKDEYDNEDNLMIDDVEKRPHTVVKTDFEGSVEYSSNLSLKIYMDVAVDNLSDVAANIDKINYFEFKINNSLEIDLSLSAETEIDEALCNLKCYAFKIIKIQWQPTFFVDSNVTLQFKGTATQQLGFEVSRNGCRNLSTDPKFDARVENTG